MSTLLFWAQLSSGHLNPLLTIARQMRSGGHTVVVAVPDRRSDTRDFHCVGLRPAPTALGLLLLPLTHGYLKTVLATKLFFNGLSHCARANCHVLDELRPDALVSDFAVPGARLAAESKGIPFIIVYQAGLSFKGSGVPPFGSGLPIGEARGWKEKLYRLLSDFLTAGNETLATGKPLLDRGQARKCSREIISAAAQLAPDSRHDQFLCLKSILILATPPKKADTSGEMIALRSLWLSF